MRAPLPPTGWGSGAPAADWAASMVVPTARALTEVVMARVMTGEEEDRAEEEDQVESRTARQNPCRRWHPEGTGAMGRW
eukprot:1062299-Prymnesium_polylepis.2